MSGQYFESNPTATSRPRVVPLVLPDLTVELQTDRAVFAGDRIDAGTKFLLLEAPIPAGAADALDLGCGYGPIAVTLAFRLPEATVWAVDVNARAVGLCAVNAAALGLTNLRPSVVQPDAPDGEVPADVRFDTIWSNPPIRIGKAALHDLLRRWLPRLTDDGHAYLVVQKHLGSDSLQRWLAAEGWSAERLCARANFRILDVSRTPVAP